MAGLRSSIMALLEQEAELDRGSALAALDRAISQTVDQLTALVQARAALRRISAIQDPPSSKPKKPKAPPAKPIPGSGISSTRRKDTMS